MKRRIFPAVLFLSLTAASCSYYVPYLSVDINTDTSPASVFYSYLCEDKPQRCVYSLVSDAVPEDQIIVHDGVIPESGYIDLGILASGDYTFSFTVYSERGGEYTALKFLDGRWKFSTGLP